MENKISKERKIMYYMGLIIIIFGGILFISSFFTFFTGFNRPNFGMGMPNSFKRALIGMICMIIGGVLMSIGEKGVAGSGLILDPEKAREDLRPYNTAKGKMINDVTSQVDLLKDVKQNLESKKAEQLIKIKCRGCGVLNDEDAMFCKACGDKI